LTKFGLELFRNFNKSTGELLSFGYVLHHA